MRTDFINLNPHCKTIGETMGRFGVEFTVAFFTAKSDRVRTPASQIIAVNAGYNIGRDGSFKRGLWAGAGAATGNLLADRIALAISTAARRMRT